jgi:hypothetical protein
MHTRNCAERCTQFLARVFAIDILAGIFLQRNRWVPPLLRAIVDEPILADVEIPTPGAALPVVRTTTDQVLMEEVVISKRE